LKYSVVNPLFKKGKKSKLNNHRSISFLTGFSKIFELMIIRQCLTFTECRKVSYGIPKGLILGPLVFLIYISDLPLILERYSLPVILVDKTSVVITDTNSTNFLIISTEIFSQLSKWFSANWLSLNFDKTHFLYLRTKNAFILDTKLEYDDKSIDTKSDTKFLQIIIEEPYNGKHT
jgi:hypothetical protein